MDNYIIWLIVGLIGGSIVMKSVFTKSKDARRQYVEKLAKFMQADVTPLEGYENSFEVKFVYKDTNFTYSDIEDPGFQTPTWRGILKAQTKDNLTMSFTEGSRTKLRADISSISDVISPWVKNAEQVSLPKELQEFTVFTNNPVRSNALLADEQIIKIFLKFKNVDSRGHPVMSLEIQEGIVVLKFHPIGSGLNPNVFDLQNNPTSVIAHLDRQMVLINKINQMKAQERA